MRSATLVESLVRMVEGHDRAAALLGDIVEIAQTRGRLWFAFAILRVLVSRLWRPVAGFIALLYASHWLLFSSQIFLYGIHAQHRPAVLWEPFFSVVIGIAGVLTGSAFFSAIRYGLDDLYTRLALTLASICALVIFAWWFPGVPYVCVALFVALFVFFCLRVQRLWALFTAALTVLVSFAVYLSGVFVLEYYQYAILHLRILGSRELDEHPSLNWLGFIFLGVVPAVAISLTCSFMHRRARQRVLPSAQPDDTLPDPRIS